MPVDRMNGPDIDLAENAERMPVDVASPFVSRQTRNVVLLTVLAIAAVALTIVVLAPIKSDDILIPIALISIPLLWIAPVFYMSRRQQRKVQRKLTELERDANRRADGDVMSSESQIAMLQAAGDGACPIWRDGLSLVQQAARRLAANGVRRRVFRIAREPATLPRIGRAFQTPFEPVRLWELNPEVLREVGDLEQDAPRFSDALRTWRRTPGVRMVRILRMTSWAGPLGLLLFVFLPQLLTGKVTALLVVALLAVLTPLAALVLTPFVGRQRQWWAVPGGVIIRDTKAFARRWTPRLIRAADGVMIHLPEASLLMVVDATDSHIKLTPSYEAEFAIRAWLSPLDPPTADRLSDFE